MTDWNRLMTAAEEDDLQSSLHSLLGPGFKPVAGRVISGSLGADVRWRRKSVARPAVSRRR